MSESGYSVIDSAYASKTKLPQMFIFLYFIELALNHCIITKPVKTLFDHENKIIIQHYYINYCKSLL